MNDAPIQTRLRVATWNLWWRFGPWQERTSAIVATLKDIDADIIALQEVWDDGTTNFAAQLAQELGYHYAFAPGARPNGIHMGNAILSRWPISQHDITPLYDDPKAPEMRVALYAEIDGPRGKIPAFCSHLNWRQQDSHIRQEQVAEVTQFIDNKRPWNYPPILCGDFNADPQAKEIRMLTGQTTVPVKNLVFHDAWSFMHPAEPGFTWDNANPHVIDGFEPDRRIDYIFTGWARGQGAGHIVDCQLQGTAPINGIWPSDHYAVVADLRY